MKPRAVDPLDPTDSSVHIPRMCHIPFKCGTAGSGLRLRGEIYACFAYILLRRKGNGQRIGVVEVPLDVTGRP